VSATLNALYGTGFMTQRDQNANDLTHLLSLSTPRTDCPTSLNSPAAAMERSAAPSQPNDQDMPLPESGNGIGFLQILVKTDIELTRGDPDEIAAIQAKVAAIRTVGEAEAYAREVTAKANMARAALDGALATPPPTRPVGA
jgi:phospholipase C